MFKSKKSVISERIISMILVISLIVMGFPGTLLASEQSNMSEIKAVADDVDSTSSVANISTDNQNTNNSNISDQENKVSSKTISNDDEDDEMEDRLRKEAESNNYRVVNLPTDETLPEEIPVEQTDTNKTSADTTKDVTTADNTTTTIQENMILHELVDKRGANIKRFLMDDMSEEAVIYPAPVHYQVKGKWQEIDNSMIDSKDDTSGDSISNKANDFKINIAKNPTADKLVSIKKDNYEVSWKMENAQETTAVVTNDDNKEFTSLTSEEQKKYVKNLNSNVSFSNILPDIDLNYEINSNNLKENIILKKASDTDSFSFNLNTKNVTPELTKANTIVFYNNEKKTPVFSFSTPVMYDAKGNTSDDISLKLNKEDNTLTLTPNKDWLKDSKRTYPVTVDPSLTVASTQFTDATVKQNSPNTTYNGASMDFLDVGNGTGTDGIEMSYLKFVLPELSSGDMVTSAKLKLYKFSSYTTSQINLYRVTNNWQVSSPSPITYSNQPNHNSAPEDFVKLTSGGGTPSFNWDITSLTKDWYVNGNNYGVLLKSPTDGTPGALALFGSTGCASTLKRPSVTINYINCSGLQNYWSYHSQKVGRAGTIYTNDYNGNVTLVHDDVTMSGNRLPVVLKHVYNTNDKNSDLGYGKGWRLNYSQTLKPVSGTTNYCAYTDEDGTVHYFKEETEWEGLYKDQSGLGLSMSGYLIRDKKNNRWQFNPDTGRLISMTDSNGNTLNITYSNDKISTITDPSGRSITLEYNQSGQLQYVIDTDNRKMTFEYADNQLTAITYPDGQSSAYEYNNSDENVLNSATNYDNYQAAIDYYCSVGGCGDNLYKVQKVREIGTDGTLGNSYEVTYTGNTTTLTDAQNRKQELMFNNSGNVTNVQNDDGSARFLSYATSPPNKVKQQSKLQSTVQNLLKNQSLEQTIGTEWASDIWGGSSHTASIVITRHSGSKGMKFVSTNASGGAGYAQYVTLSAGKTYTFSAYVKTDNVSSGSGGAKLFVVYPNSNAASTRVITGTNAWQRIAVTFTVPGSSGSSSIRVEAALSDATGTAYFDDFQLEEGTCNRYNYLENGDFTSYDSSNNPNYWTKSSDCTNADIVTTDNGTDHPQKLDTKVFKINGDVTKAKSLSKTISMSINEGDIIVFGGWAKADSAPMYSDIRVFDIELTMLGSVTKLNFNPSCKDWQYVTGMVKCPISNTSATISLNYSNNYNSVMFDGIQLYKESYGNSYVYDSNGNLTSVVDLANSNYSFTYTGNDIKYYTDGNGNVYYCAYNDNHNLIEVDSPTQAKQNFTYDSNGNIISETNGYYAVTFANTGYTPNGNYAAEVIDPLSNTISYNRNDKNGNLDVVNDAKNNSVYYQYDYLGRLTNTYSTGKDLPAESFNFENHTTRGSNGTKPTIDNPSYTTDSNNHYVLNASAGVTQHVEYTLGVSKTSGTMLLWFNPNQAGLGTKRYLISNDAANNTPFRLCLDSDNRLKLETKYGTAISLKYSWSVGNGYASTANTWYFGGMSWRLLGTGLQYTLYLNNTSCSGRVSLNDFTGATTTLGQTKADSYKFNGLIDQFVYSGNQLAPSDINQSSAGIYQQGRGSYAVKTTECFPLNQAATGSRGTDPLKNHYQYENDETGKPVLAAKSNGSNKLQYKAGINRVSGTMNTWFKTTNNGTKRYIISNQITGSNAILDFYVDTDNIAKLAVKNSANNLLVLNSGVAISSNTWYFGGFSWSYNTQGNLILKLYINGNVSTATYSNTLDFSGATTTLGGNISGNNKLNGNLEQFIYSNKCLTDADMQGIYNLGRGNYLSANGANNQYTYQNDQLNTVSANGVTYHFSYDRFGNSAGVAVGTQNIVTNNYNNAQGSYTSNLTGSTYGNGNTVALDYDDLNRVIKTTYNGQDSFKYQYNDMGALGSLKDQVNNVNYKYMYDFAGRLVQVEDGADNGAGSNFTYTNTTGFTYDKNNNVLTLNETVKNNAGADSPYTTTYVYNKDDKVASVTTSGSGNSGTKVTIYETLNTKLGRISSTKLNNNFTTTYTYVPGTAGFGTSHMIASISNGGSAINYTYDRNGNIETITEGTNTIKYTYNELNELIREDNQVLNKTLVYSYDKGGNILSKVQYPYTTGTLGTPTSTINYVYGDNNWKDKLTSYNGQSITYDAIGNPLTYNGKTYTWERGNELAGISGGGLTASYKYNSDGIRTVKTVNGVTTKYHLVGDKVTYESNGNDTIYYSYDPNGNLVSMNLNGTEYFYVRNAQGDIIKIVNASGTVVVSYVYDTWGKLISTTGTLASTIGAKNPYRYRGYRYDSETGLYYLQSRYYNPEWGRFINADSLVGKPGVLLSHNLFAYCGNNPVNMVDPDGNNPIVIYLMLLMSTPDFQQDVNMLMMDASTGDLPALIIDGILTLIPGAPAGIGKVVCFTADTEIQIKDGHKFIKDIKVGYEVYSENPDTGEKGFKKVKNVFINETDTLIHISIGNTEIKTTPTHPFWVIDKGWVEAGNLNIRDKMLLSSGETAEIGLINKEFLNQPINVYNFEVEDWHTYFVSDKNVLVHNSCAMPSAKWFEKTYGLGKGGFHKVKKEILKQLTSKDSPYKEIMQQVGDNPDIGLDNLGNIVVKSRTSEMQFTTDWSFESYLP